MTSEVNALDQILFRGFIHFPFLFIFYKMIFISLHSSFNLHSHKQISFTKRKVRYFEIFMFIFVCSRGVILCCDLKEKQQLQQQQLSYYKFKNVYQ